LLAYTTSVGSNALQVKQFKVHNQITFFK